MELLYYVTGTTLTYLTFIVIGAEDFQHSRIRFARPSVSRDYNVKSVRLMSRVY